MIRWDEPIEAVHEDGRVALVRLDPSHDQPDDGTYTITDEPRDCDWYFTADGLPVPGSYEGWRIRNVAQATETGSTAPSPSEVGPEVQRAAVMQLAEAAAALNIALDGKGYDAERQAIVDAMKAVRNAGVLLPEPVDADLVEARRIVCDSVPSWNDDHRRACMRGDYDSNLFVVIAQRALEKEAGR